MREWRRDTWRIVTFTLMCVGLTASIRAENGARRAQPSIVRATLEVTWKTPQPPELPELPKEHQATGSSQTVEAELAEGKIVDVLVGGSAGDHLLANTLRARVAAGDSPARRVLGDSHEGHVHVRVEAPISGDLLIRAGGRLTRFSLSSLVDRPQRTLPDAPVEVVVRRIPWDPIAFELVEGEGVCAPGSLVPIALGFNILSAEPCDIGLQYVAELRSARDSSVHWRYDGRPEVLQTNTTDAVQRRIVVPMPNEEGTYVLEVRASWDSAASLEASALSRLLRRKRSGPSGSAIRRGSLVVFDAGNRDKATADGNAPPRVVDQIELARARSGRAVASGRAPIGGLDKRWPVPTEALVEPRFRDRVKGWISRSDEHLLAPADATTVAWSALELKSGRLGQAHRLTVTLNDGPVEALGVALVVPGTSSAQERMLLDASVSSRVSEDAQSSRTVSWLVWPDHASPVLVLVNRNDLAPLSLKSITLEELPGGARPAEVGLIPSENARSLMLHILDTDLKRMGGAVDGSAVVDRAALVRNIHGYARHCGASSVVVPQTLADRQGRLALDGQGHEDSLAPDMLDLLLRELKTTGMTAVVEVDCSEQIDNLPPPNSIGARQRGLVRLDSRGEPTGDAYNLVHPDVRAALRRSVTAAVAPRARHANLVGVLIRLGPESSLLGPLASGLDDRTYAEFVSAKFPAQESAQIPGLDKQAEDRFASRAGFVEGPGRTAWLDWRASTIGQVYSELADAVTESGPGGILALVTPVVDEGSAGEAARSADNAGDPADRAWQALGLELMHWEARPDNLVVLRGVADPIDPMAADLATNPELDAAVLTQKVRGVWIGGATPDERDALTMTGGGSGAALETAFGHSMAVLDPSWVVISASAVTGRETDVANFARAYRALPRPQPEARPAPPLASGVAVRSWQRAGQTYVMIANDTPYEILQAAIARVPTGTVIEDVGRDVRLEPTEAPGGGQSLVLRLPAFGVATLRVGAPGVEIETGGSYLPAMSTLESQAEGLSTRLGRSETFAGPPMPGFEPRARTIHPTSTTPAGTGTDTEATQVVGWSSSGSSSNPLRLDTERPHEGRAALRMQAILRDAGAVSDEFLPPGGSTLIVKSWLRADIDGARVRVRVEGRTSMGEVVRRHADVPVDAGWTERVVRVPDLPADGLESMQVAFEWISDAPGTLWIDDVAVAGAGPSASEGRARRVLLEALQAYRARRFADFARLIGSRRAKQAIPDLAADRAEPIRTGRASDLPANRRLR